MIYERPVIFSDNKKLFKTHSHELHIKGSGYPKSTSSLVYKPMLKFHPPLIEGTDYTLRVVDGSEMEIFPLGLKVYQSVLSQSIMITGTGFKEDMQITFDPPLKQGSDYDIEVSSDKKIILKLQPQKKWRSEAGQLIAKSIKLDNEYKSLGSKGIVIATVLEDPVITPSMNKYHESQSKLIVIQGKGFTNAADTKITISTESTAYRILSALEDAIRLLLQPNQAWLPSFNSFKDSDENKKIAMQVSSIDTGAGVVPVDNVIVGYIIKDREGVVCDDSCEFAFDGVCDDGSESSDLYYHYDTYSKYAVDFDRDHVNYQNNSCFEGTDCTDCEGVDAIPVLSQSLYEYMSVST